jgi:hypothetical protein
VLSGGGCVSVLQEAIRLLTVWDGMGKALLTLFGTLEADVELLHVVVDQCDFVVAHQHLHDVRLDSALWTGHFGLCVV